MLDREAVVERDLGNVMHPMVAPKQHFGHTIVLGPPLVLTRREVGVKIDLQIGAHPQEGRAGSPSGRLDERREHAG